MQNDYTKTELEKETKPLEEEKLGKFERAMQLAEHFDYFYDASGATFVKVEGKVFPINGKYFGDLLSLQYYQTHNRGLSPEIIRTLLATLSAKARCEGECRSVFKRVAYLDNRLYINLARSDHKVVEITASGWGIIECPSHINFLTISTMQSLPLPSETSADFNLLNRYLNCDKETWILLYGFILGTLMPSPPYPILLLCGEAGTGKSTMTKLLKRLIDPNLGEHTKTPKEVRDLLAYGKSNHLLCIDNNSKISGELSDDLCRIASGSPNVGRKLYSDHDEFILYLAAPIIINGINNNVTRGDLLDRALVVELQPVEKRQNEQQLFAGFEQDLPVILAGLYNHVANALKRRKTIPILDGFRLVDFVQWVNAAMGNDSFATLYRRCIRDNKQVLLQNDPLGLVLLQFIEKERQITTKWLGTATELLCNLNNIRQTSRFYSRIFPDNPKALSSWLRRLTPLLREANIEVQFDRTRSQRRIFINFEEYHVTHVTSVTYNDEDDDNDAHLTQVLAGAAVQANPTIQT